MMNLCSTPMLSLIANLPDPSELMQEIAHQHLFNQFWLSVFFVIPMVLVARAVVAGTRYSAILIIVIFGLLMGFLLVHTGVSKAGLTDFPMLSMIAQSTIIALAASFFVGGQELRRLFSKAEERPQDPIAYSTEQVFFGTGRTQLIFIARSFFLLLGLEALTRLFTDSVPSHTLGTYYPLIAYLGLVIAVILIDYKATVPDKRSYLRKGLLEIAVIAALLWCGHGLAMAVRPTIALPQIFFVMLLAAGLGALLHRWSHGPAIRCLLFAGIPVVLAANFIIGGSRISEAFALSGLNPVIAYGFFGQVFWMFGGISLILLIGRTRAIRNIGPAMAGGLSHAGLTGACTAGDLGDRASRRAPIMINIPFFGHVFVFSVLALSIAHKGLLILPSLCLALIGLALTFWALRNLRKLKEQDAAEVKALMQFSFGWQLTAVFGGLLLLEFSGMPIGNALMATSSSLSHFGLFAAIQGGMAGEAATGLIAFVFAMPFLVHPLVFFMFGRAMEQEGQMPSKPVYGMALLSMLGVIAALTLME
jgi:hypothetical protein